MMYDDHDDHDYDHDQANVDAVGWAVMGAMALAVVFALGYVAQQRWSTRRIEARCRELGGTAVIDADGTVHRCEVRDGQR